MSRGTRIILAILALLLTIGGAATARARTAQSMATLVTDMVHAKTPTPDLANGLEEDVVPREMLGEALIGAGLLIWIVLGARAAGTSPALKISAMLVTIIATAAAVFFPSTRIPKMALVQPPSDEWPYGVVALDTSCWSCFLVRTKKDEWAMRIEKGSGLGPLGVKNILGQRMEKEQRPVRAYMDLDCPDDIQKVFLDAVHGVADPVSASVEDVTLPPVQDFQIIRQRRMEERLAIYKDTLDVGILAHLAGAAALALVVWWMPKQAGLRGYSLIAAGNLVLSFAQAIALPVALYVAMMPDQPGAPNWKRLSTHVLPHVWIFVVSSGALALGSLVAFAGNLLEAFSDKPPLPPAPVVKSS
jgi:hypothetical protein